MPNSHWRECACGQMYFCAWTHNGYATWPYFILGRHGVRLCVTCGRLLTYDSTIAGWE
jgi:hypothetical protein